MSELEFSLGIGIAEPATSAATKLFLAAASSPTIEGSFRHSRHRSTESASESRIAERISLSAEKVCELISNGHSVLPRVSATKLRQLR
jgi:hypothetical protein